MTYVAIYGSALSIPNPEFTRIEKPKIIRHFFFYHLSTSDYFGFRIRGLY